MEQLAHGVTKPGENVPGPQIVHAPDCGTAEYLPAPQRVQDVDWDVLKYPASHTAQLVDSVSAAYVPDGHAVHDGKPEDTANRPTGHTVHTDELATLVRPAGHAAQGAEPPGE